MSNESIKMKTSVVGTTESATPEAPDSYELETNEPEKPTIGSGNSGYAKSDAKLSSWRGVSSGRAGQSTSPVDGVTSGMEGIVPICEAINQNSMPPTDTEAKILAAVNYMPKTKFEAFQLMVKGIDCSKFVNLYEGWEEIPEYSKRDADLGSPKATEAYYLNRLGMIDDLLASAREQKATHPDPNMRIDYHYKIEFLEEQKTFVKEQLAAILTDQLQNPTEV